MIFKFMGEKRVFIHIPKTGGNTIQKFLQASGMALDTLVVGVGGDGEHRFGVKGTITQNKHQTILEYIKLDPMTAGINKLSCVRKPFERMVSLYFSPHRWITINNQGEAVLPGRAPFCEEDFCNLVYSEKASWQILSTNKNQYVPPVLLETLRTESLDSDMETYFPGTFQVSGRKNESPYREEASIVLGSKELRSAVESSHHGIDLSLFY